jgi:hypothetical protein
MSYLTGPYDGSANGEGLGKLTAGFGARGDQPTKDGGKIGPEFTFGIYMEKELKEPILIIKTAWGGRSLNTEFRPPSAGLNCKDSGTVGQHPQGAHGVPKLEDRKKWQEDKDAASGVFYRMMIDHVKTVLADPKRVCPEYDEKAGYELAGFVWLQGFNDLVDGTTYPGPNEPGKCDVYMELLAKFIRDVRKDLSAPKRPFVIGVLGVGGESENVIFRKAMAAPADMPEFKGNVVAVETAPFWDHDIAAAQLSRAYNNIVNIAHLKKDGLDRDGNGRTTGSRLANLCRRNGLGASSRLIPLKRRTSWKNMTTGDSVTSRCQPGWRIGTRPTSMTANGRQARPPSERASGNTAESPWTNSPQHGERANSC